MTVLRVDFEHILLDLFHFVPVDPNFTKDRFIFENLIGNRCSRSMNRTHDGLKTNTRKCAGRVEHKRWVYFILVEDTTVFDSTWEMIGIGTTLVEASETGTFLLADHTICVRWTFERLLDAHQCTTNSFVHFRRPQCTVQMAPLTDIKIEQSSRDETALRGIEHTRWILPSRPVGRLIANATAECTDALIFFGIGWQWYLHIWNELLDVIGVGRPNHGFQGRAGLPSFPSNIFPSFITIGLQRRRSAHAIHCLHLLDGVYLSEIFLPSFQW